MKTVFAFTPAQQDADLVPYVNLSRDPQAAGDMSVLTVRQKGGVTAAMSIGECELIQFALAILKEFNVTNLE